MYTINFYYPEVGLIVVIGVLLFVGIKTLIEIIPL